MFVSLATSTLARDSFSKSLLRGANPRLLLSLANQLAIIVVGNRSFRTLIVDAIKSWKVSELSCFPQACHDMHLHACLSKTTVLNDGVKR
jgi:hypothetical protein